MFKFFQTIKTIKKLREINPDKRWLKNQRLYFARMAQAEEPGASAKWIFLKSKLVISLTAILIVLSLGGGAINSAKAALPSDVLFPVKLFTEKIQGLLIIGNENKIDFTLKLAEKRLEEIEQRIEKNNGESPNNKDITAEAIRLAKNNLEKAGTLMAQTVDSKNNGEKNLKQIERVFEKLEKVAERKNQLAKKLTAENPDLTATFNSLDLASIKIEEEINTKINVTGQGEDAAKIIKNQAKKSMERAENKIRNIGRKLLNTDLDQNGENEKSEKEQEETLKKLEKLANKLEKSAEKIESAVEKLEDAKKEFSEKDFNEAIKKANAAFKKTMEEE